jgi:segregation and condensation protein B
VTPLAKLLEAALFASPRPIPFDALATLDPEASPAALSSALDELREHYDVDGHGVELVEQGGGWQILTRPEYTEAIERAQVSVRPQRLSSPSLETLAIIAYRQPIGRAEIEEIRGVAVGSVLKSLHERNLIDIVGRSEGIGRPLLYGTTALFLEQFGLRHLEELPRADELAIALRGAGGLVGTPVEPPPPLLPLGEHVMAEGAADAATVTDHAADTDALESADASEMVAQAPVDHDTDDELADAVASDAEAEADTPSSEPADSASDDDSPYASASDEPVHPASVE